MDKLSILAPAKINLYLDVKDRRQDGYHDIVTIMQSVTLFDRLTVTKGEPSGEKKIDVTCRDFLAPEGVGNLVYRAAEVFFNTTMTADYHVSFVIEKKIPSEAGLGGGSSDAAAAILALNRLYGTSLSIEQMGDIGATIGADVPFCIRKGTALAQGIGEKLSSCTPMPDCAIVIAMPAGSRISTAEAYRKIDGITEIAPVTQEEFLAAMAGCDLDTIGRLMFNKFERVTPLYSGSHALREKMLALGAVGARMSGSGSAVFGLFHDIGTARRAKEALEEESSAFLCAPARADTPYFED